MKDTHSELGRVVFARIGFMRFYAGPVPGDERPVGGGEFNRTDIGGEVLNFKRHGYRLYGFFATAMANPEVNLGRIDPAASETSVLDDVLVVFVARHPVRGQVVVGWYASAKVFRLRKTRPVPDDAYRYRCVANVSDAVLLPDAMRVHRIPNGAGAMGQANVCYALDQDGSPKRARWMKRAIEYVRSYDGENLLVDELSDAVADIAAEAEKALSRAQGRWLVDAKQRQALEDYGVAKAIAHYKKAGFAVKDVGGEASYDLRCTKGGKTLCVEVKTTTTSGAQVILTPREAEMKGARALFLVHSVMLVKDKPKGGVQRELRPWKVDAKRLKAISYMYRLPEK